MAVSEAESLKCYEEFEDHEKKPRRNKYAFACAILASMTSILLLGYDIGVMSGAVLYIQRDLKVSGVQIEILNRVTSGFISMTLLSLYKAIITIGRVFFLFAGVAVAAWIFHYTLLPETRGKTLEEIEKSFGNFCRKPKEEAEGVVDDNDEIQIKTCDQTLTSMD